MRRQEIDNAYHILLILKAQIENVWGSIPIPSNIELCMPQSSNIFLEPKEITNWIQGKKFDEIQASNNFSNLMPFYYFNELAASYYLGSYLLSSCQTLLSESESIHDNFGFIHMSEWISSGQFNKVFAGLPYACKTVALAFIEVILILAEEIELTADFVFGYYSSLKINRNLLLNS